MKIKVILALIAVLAGVLLFLLKRNKPAAKPGDKLEFSEEEYERYYEAKEEALERILGPMHDMVGHALIPFQVGGAVDMYYFPNGIPGTGFATMELIEPDGSGPRPNRIGTFELVAFTRHKMPSSEGEADKTHPFNQIERRMCGILTVVGRHSYDEVLNPGDTCEIPGDEGEPAKCLILDEYRGPDDKDFTIDGKRHCLLLCLEVFRSEMEYAMRHGSAVVLRKLKEKGYYPYSDLDREPVF